MTCVFTFLDADADHKYHDFAGIQGWILVSLKLLVYLFFLYKWRNSRRPNNSDSFYKLLFYFGSAYLLAIPTSVVSTFLFAPCERQWVFNFLSHTFMYSTTAILYF